MFEAPPLALFDQLMEHDMNQLVLKSMLMMKKNGNAAVRTENREIYLRSFEILNGMFLSAVRWEDVKDVMIIVVKLRRKKM